MGKNKFFFFPYVNNKFQGINNSAIKTKHLTIYHLTPMQSARTLTEQGIFSSALNILKLFYKKHMDASVIKKCEQRYIVALGSRERIAVPVLRL